MPLTPRSTDSARHFTYAVVTILRCNCNTTAIRPQYDLRASHAKSHAIRAAVESHWCCSCSYFVNKQKLRLLFSVNNAVHRIIDIGVSRHHWTDQPGLYFKHLLVNRRYNELKIIEITTAQSTRREAIGEHKRGQSTCLAYNSALPIYGNCQAPSIPSTWGMLACLFSNVRARVKAEEIILFSFYTSKI